MRAVRVGHLDRDAVVARGGVLIGGQRDLAGVRVDLNLAREVGVIALARSEGGVLGKWGAVRVGGGVDKRFLAARCLGLLVGGVVRAGVVGDDEDGFCLVARAVWVGEEDRDGHAGAVERVGVRGDGEVADLVRLPKGPAFRRIGDGDLCALRQLAVTILGHLGFLASRALGRAVARIVVGGLVGGIVIAALVLRNSDGDGRGVGGAVRVGHLDRDLVVTRGGVLVWRDDDLAGVWIDFDLARHIVLAGREGRVIRQVRAVRVLRRSDLGRLAGRGHRILVARIILVLIQRQHGKRRGDRLLGAIRVGNQDRDVYLARACVLRRGDCEVAALVRLGGGPSLR